MKCFLYTYFVALYKEDEIRSYSRSLYYIIALTCLRETVFSRIKTKTANYLKNRN